MVQAAKTLKTLILVGAMPLVPFLTGDTAAQSKLVPPPPAVNPYTTALQDVRARLDFLDGLLLDVVNGLPGVAYAGTTVTCKNGKSFHISVDGGSCKIIQFTDSPTAEVASGSCTNKNGDEANASCVLNGGQGGCSDTKGTGNCTPR